MSSAAESRAQRQAALEERRRRIASLREARTQRAEDTARVQQQHQNLDEYVTGLLKEPAPGGGGGGVAAAMDAIPSLVTEETAADATAADAAANDKAAMATTTAMAQSDNVVAQAVAPAPPPPKQVETFTIGTQTEEEDFVEEMTQTDEREEEEEEEEETTKDKDDDKESSKAKKSSQQAAENENERKKQQQQQEQENGEPKILTSHELEKEVSSQPFSTFINTASKKVERMLGTPLLSDLLVDYVGATDGDDDDEITAAASKREAAAAAAATSNKYLQDRQIYSCPKWTAGREVTNLDWSPLHRELFLSTHHVAVSISADAAAKTSSSSSSSISTTAITAIGPHHTYDTPSASLTPRSGELQSDGLALIWSLSMPQRPEHVFTCGSPVTTGRFHPTDAKLVVGGCASGQIVVWDVRAGRLPVQKSALVVVTGKSSSNSSQQHTHPIGTMEVLEGGAGFVTSSTDGKVNFWSLSNLREPAESLQLGDSVSCLAVAPESGTLVLGDENGSLYAATATSGKRRQVRKFDTGEGGGHYGMVTALSTKRLKTGAPSRAAGLAKGFLRGSGGLILSAGVDWTVQLWAPAYKDTPLTSLVSHSYDYMSDVKWSPSHPSLFATASSNGSVGLWNLSTSLDEPITNVVVEPDSSRGLNRLSWSLDGRRLAAASSDQVHLLNLTEEAIGTKGDEDAKSMMNHFMARGWISRQ